jgi:hypothetical protein
MSAASDQDDPQDPGDAQSTAGSEQSAAGGEAADSRQAPATEPDGQTPSTEELEEPSTEKPPGEEPKAPGGDGPEPSHQAVGIGVIGRPLVEPEGAERAES